MILFENKSEITLEKYLYLCNNPIGKKSKRKLRNWRMLMCFAMLVMAVNAVVCFVSDAVPIAVISAALWLSFLYKLLFQRNRANTKLYKDIMENRMNGEWFRTITFDPKEVKATDGNTVTTFKYKDFVRFDQDSKYYLLFKNENAVLRVEKGSFTIGDEAEFVKTMSKKIKG